MKIIIAFLWIGTISASLAAQEPNLDTVTTIRALEHEWADAQSHNDNGALDLIFDNDLVYVEYGRLVSKGEYLSRIRHEVSGEDIVVMEAISVKTFGGTAIAIGSYREKQLKSGRGGARRWRFIDTWIYKNHAWVLVAAAAAPVTK